MRNPAPLVLAAIFWATSTSAGTISDGRFVSSGGEFSIAMQSTMDREFKAGDELSNADIVLVDMSYAMADAHFGFAQRTIEWLKLAKPVEPASYDAQASDTVNGYLEGRLAENKFVITDRKKSRNEAGQLVYSFSATGAVNGTPAAWNGVVLFFDSGVALVSEFHALGTKPMLDADGLTDAEFAAWAATLRPGK